MKVYLITDKDLEDLIDCMEPEALDHAKIEVITICGEVRREVVRWKQRIQERKGIES